MAFILLGPNVGPDGNVYAVATQGIGVFSLTPQGALRWPCPKIIPGPSSHFRKSSSRQPRASRLYFHANDHFKSFGLDGTPTLHVCGRPAAGRPSARCQPGWVGFTQICSRSGTEPDAGKFDANGGAVWQTFDKFVTSTNTLSTPEAGSDSVVYDGRNLASLYSFNPGSSIRWQYIDSGILFAPIVSPCKRSDFRGRSRHYGQPGFFEAISTSGISLWKLVLPVENGLNIVPISRARFTPDGQTAYIGTSISGANL